MYQQIQGFRLSPQQRRLWLLTGAVEASAQCAILVRGDVDPACLESALQRVVERQQILRTKFVRPPGRRVPLQVVEEHPDWSSDREVAGEAGAEPAVLAERLIAEERGGPPGSGENGPPVKSRLVELPQGWLWLLSFPALSADARSLANLFGQIADALDGRGGLEGNELQYLNVSEWLNDILEDEDAETGKAYWRRYDLARWAMELPGTAAGAAGDPRRATVPVPLDPAVWKGVEALASACGARVGTVLLAAWQSLLFRWAGGKLVAVGAVFDGRKYEDLAGVLGVLAKAVPIASDLASELPFRQVVERAAQAVSESSGWQEYFLWEGEAEGELPRFTVGWEVEELPAPREISGLSLELLRTRTSIEPFAVKLACVCRAGAWNAELEVDAGRLAPQEAERLAARLAALVSSAVTRPETPIGELEALTTAEREWLLIELNRTARDLGTERCLHELVAARIASSPEAEAAVCGEARLSFAELDRRANHLAHRLRRLGIGPDVVVGISARRSLEMLVGVLAILKAGGAYLPLDPSYPQERLRFMLDQARAPVVLVGAEGAALPATGAEQVPLEIAGESPAPPQTGVGPANLAYVIFTSGSTGRPKGVMISHGAAANYLRWCSEAYDVAGGQGAPIHSSLGFDLTVTSLFAPLLVGRSVMLLPDAEGIEALAGVLRDGPEFSLVKITPSHLDLLEELLGGEGEGAAHTAPRALVIGGEALHGESLVRWRARHPNLRIINEYGPTEATVGCCVHEVAPGEAPPAGPVPIGRPIANVRLYLLDQNLQPVAPGSVGELFIGGACLSRGYLRNAEATAGSFLPDPFAAAGGARLYRTGDLARHLPDGALEFLGRGDQQVKVRGFRIELGEIEAVLARHPQVHQCVVVLRGDGERCLLVAYTVAERGTAPGAEELRAFLAEELPEHMLPAAFVQLPALPLTANGKVDRKALPEPERHPAGGGDSVVPRSEVEKILAQIWAEVLRLPQVGIHDNFFRVGGDSILGVQMIARANEAGLPLTSRQLFQHQTIAELAEVVGTVALPVADQRPVSGPVPLTPIQRWFFDQPQPEPHHFNQPLLLALRRPIEPRHLDRALDALLTHHDALRLRCEREGAGWRQWNAEPGGEVPFTAIDLSALATLDQAKAREAAATAIQGSLDLTRGPIVRLAQFMESAEGSGRLLLVPHHLAVDGVSLRILLEDLQSALESLMRGEQPSLPAKTTSFKSWAEALEKRAGSGVLERELLYWTASERRQVAPLPVDLPGGVNTVASLAVIPVWLEEDETRELLQEVPRLYSTQINDVLLTCLGETLAAWSGSRRLLIDLESHGRTDLEPGLDTSRTVGWFTSFFPVLLDLEDAPDLGAALKAVKEQHRKIPGHGIGYGLLRYLAPEPAVREALIALPQAQVIFNYLGQFDQFIPGDSLFLPVREPIGPARDPRGLRSHQITINGRVLGGRLQFEWSFSENLHLRETIESLAAGFVAQLRDLIAYCRSPQAGGYTPSDFPLAQVGQEELDLALGEVEFGE